MILAQNLRRAIIQHTDHMKLKKEEYRSLDASILLRRGNKINMGDRGSEGHGKERGGGWKKSRDRIRYRKRREKYRGQEIEQKHVAVEYGELEEATKKSQMQEIPRTQQG